MSDELKKALDVLESQGFILVPKDTYAALTAERDAERARVAELEGVRAELIVAIGQRDRARAALNKKGPTDE